MAARGGAGGGTTARLVRPRSSLLGRVIAVLGLSFFAVEVTILGVFTAGAWRWLVERREEDLREHGDRLHGVARAALDARGRPDDTAEVDSALAAALARPGDPGRAAPPVAAPEPPGGVAIEAWVLTRGGEALRVSGGLLEPVHADASPATRWPADLASEVTGLLRDGASVASVVSARLPRGAFLSERLVRVLPLPGARGAPDAVLVLESPLRDAQRQLVAWGFGAFGVGAVALLITAMVTTSYLRRALLAPLGRMIRADNAARRGDRLGAIVDEAAIPDDEVGAIMRSRNALFLNMVASREALDRQNAELARQREELRAWGKELERLVEHKTTALLGARDTLHRTEKLAAVGRLAANVAHEINNPLASIAGYAEAAREQLAANEKDEVAQALGTIETQAFRCKEILKRLLGLARADAVEVQDVELGELVKETVGLVEVAARRRAVAVSFEDGEAPTIRSDRGALQQVILNLLDNAVDAAAVAGETAQDPEKALTPRPAWVRARVQGGGQGEVQVVVTDSGRGVPEAVRARIFDPFYTTKPVGRGTGLGLAISHSLVERLGGRITVDSAPGGGAAFTVHLPTAGPPQRSSATSRLSLAAGLAASSAEPRPASASAAPTKPPRAAPPASDVSSLLDDQLVQATSGDADPDA